MGCGNSKTETDILINQKVFSINDNYNLNGMQIKNRFVMGPLTRCRANPKDGIPNDLMVKYYGQRSDFGLIITECIPISTLSNAFPGAGGLYNEAQRDGWKKITDRVHQNGAKIIAQIWHSGRQTPSEFIGGQKPIAPSAIAVGQDHAVLKTPYPVPKEMTQSDIKEVISQFQNTAKLAKQAGFDGVQIHAGNGFLVDQFWRDGTNKRIDNYGGSLENRCRFLLEIIDAVSKVYKSNRISVRFTPTGRYGGMFDSNPLELTKYTLKQLSKKNLQFVEIKRHGFMDGAASENDPSIDKNGLLMPETQMPNFYQSIRSSYNGILMGNEGYTPETAEQGIKEGLFDIVSFSHLAIDNPDLPERYQNGWEINNKPDYSTYFQGGAKGYTDIPRYNEQKVSILDDYNLNGMQIKNRFVMGPLTRCRANPEDGIPNDLMVKYYGQRSDFGQIITECIPISSLSNAFPGAGGLYNEAQRDGWKKITDRVHQNGAKIIAQIWHSGRQTPSEFIGGQKPIAPSAIAFDQDHAVLKTPYPVPKEMTQSDIKEVISQFQNTAKLAKQAGFDGVQIHAGNGFLVDQFWRDGTNKRIDNYGGSLENRCRFLLEIIDAVSKVYNSNRISVRFTPTGRYGGMFDSNPLELTKYTLKQLSKKNLQFVEIKKHGFKEGVASDNDPTIDKNGLPMPETQMPNFYQSIRSSYNGILMGNEGYTPETAEQGIKEGLFDIVSFSHLAIDNPDLPERYQNGWEINNKPDYSTYFQGGAKGYTDIPRYNEQKVSILDDYNLNGMQIKNRFVMGPLTRCRANPEDGIPNDLMVKYYGQRSDFGQIITECIPISTLSNAFPGAGGLYNEAQRDGWKKITDKVHQNGAKIIAQIWHSGRQTPSEFIGGQKPIAPSAIAVGQDHAVLKTPYPVPKEMTQSDIKEVIGQFQNTAKLAKQAGFDGVQIHAGNGFLVDQFWRDGTNKRIDNYGGSLENRCRFLLEIIDAVSKVYKSNRISVRFTPTGRYGGMFDSNPLELTKYTLKQLSKKNLQFVEIKRHGYMDGAASENDPTIDKNGLPMPETQMPNFYQSIRSSYNGILMGNEGYTPETAEQGIKEGLFDIVSFSHLAIDNPDLPERYQNGWEINNKPDYSTYFQGGAKGYTDIPRYQQQS